VSITIYTPLDPPLAWIQRRLYEKAQSSLYKLLICKVTSIHSVVLHAVIINELQCCMYSSRKCSVKRHINNLHNGIGNIVSFIDYVAGRRNGIYFLSQFLITYSSRPRRCLQIVYRWML
jgi:hypothetical protein